MQKLLPLQPGLSLHDLFLFSVDGVMIVVEPVSSLADPCFACIGCWRDMRLLVQGDLPRCVGRHLPRTQLVDQDLLA